MPQIKIAIVDDDTLIVNLLRDFLSTHEEIKIAFTAGDGSECIDILRTSQTDQLPDVILLDLKMGKMNGIETSEILKAEFPDIHKIIISSHYNKSFMGFMLKTGVSAFLPKGIAPVELIDIIKEVHKNDFFFMKDQMDVIREQLSSKSPKPKLIQENTLSERETDVLKLICQQKTAKEIGEILFITQRTVEGHKNNLFIKTGAKNIAGLVIYAIQNEIIHAKDLPII